MWRATIIATPTLASLALTLLLGWLAGGLVNWAADVLPGRGRDRPAPLAAAQGASLRHYLTLPWYPFRRGICPHCGIRRPIRAPVVEAASIVAFLVCWMLDAGSWMLGVRWLYTTFLLAVIVIDFEHRRVLNVMVGPAAGAALLLSLRPGGPGIANAALGGLAGFGLFALIALLGRGKMGAGDVKLAGVIGLMTGFPAVFSALLLGVILGGLAALALILSRRATLKSTIAYAPYLAIAAWVVLLI